MARRGKKGGGPGFGPGFGQPRKGGHTGTIHAHRMTDKGAGPGHDASHGKHNASLGLPQDMYGHAGEGYTPGAEGENEECC